MRGLIFIAAACLAACLGATAAPAATPVKWVKAESPHFVIYSDTSAKTASAYLLRLEQYRYVLASFYGIADQAENDMPPLRLYFLKDFADLKETWPNVSPNVAGYYKPCAEGQAAMAMYWDDKIKTAAHVEDQTSNDSQTILFHEYAHTFMFQTSNVRYPPWFVEGFAEYYGTTRVQDGEALVGMAWQQRVDELMSDGWGLPYEDLLRGTKAVYSSPRAIDQYYAQSWLLTHWIMSDAARLAQFKTFLDRIDKKEDQVSAFEAAFGIKVKDLDHTLDVYLRHMRAHIYPVAGMPTPRITVEDMPASADKLLLWDATVRICPGKSDWPRLMTSIKAEAARYPADDYAQLALARAYIEIDDESLALPFLKTYVAAHPGDAEANYMLGQTWYLMTLHNHIEPGETKASQMAHARDLLGRAYGLDPLNAPNLYYFSLAQADLPDYPNENAVNAITEAASLAPQVRDYAIQAADVLIQTGDMDYARTMLIPMASNPHGGATAAWASRVVDAIDSGKSRDEVLRMLHTPVASSDEDEGDTGKDKS